VGKKLKTLTSLYAETINEVTNNADKWTSFLKCAGWNFKYGFDEQILIHAQRPNATACATMEEWNTKCKRWVTEGSKAIALLDDTNRYKMRFVFDISDTNSVYGNNIRLWTADKQYENDIIEGLENRFGNLERKGTLAEAIISASYNLVQDNMQDYLDGLLNYTQGSHLENMEADELYRKGSSNACQ